MKKEPQAIKCIVCKETFMAKRSDAKFCTPNCRQKFVRTPEKYTGKLTLPEDKKKDAPPPPDPPKNENKKNTTERALPSNWDTMGKAEKLQWFTANK